MSCERVKVCVQGGASFAGISLVSRSPRKMNWSDVCRISIVEFTSFTHDLSPVNSIDSETAAEKDSHGGRLADRIRCGRCRNRYWFLSIWEKETNRPVFAGKRIFSPIINSRYHDFRQVWPSPSSPRQQVESAKRFCTWTGNARPAFIFFYFLLHR